MRAAEPQTVRPHESALMNLAFLGDALDHWKGSLFESLHGAGVLQNFAVDAMASDAEAWRPEDGALLARLLRVEQRQVIRHTASLLSREAYFAEIDHRGDLFLDPDTGVATGPVKEPERYVKPEEVKNLLATAPDRLLVVYQHVRAQRPSDRVDAVLASLRAQAGDFAWSSYESGTVAMLFLSRKEERACAVADHFRGLLGRHADGRIRARRKREV